MNEQFLDRSHYPTECPTYVSLQPAIKNITGEGLGQRCLKRRVRWRRSCGGTFSALRYVPISSSTKRISNAAPHHHQHLTPFLSTCRWCRTQGYNCNRGMSVRFSCHRHCHHRCHSRDVRPLSHESWRLGPESRHTSSLAPTQDARELTALSRNKFCQITLLIMDVFSGSTCTVYGMHCPPPPANATLRGPGKTLGTRSKRPLRFDES